MNNPEPDNTTSNDADEMYDAYIAYKHDHGDDDIIVEKIAKKLNKDFEIWFDKWTPIPGLDTQDQMYEGLKKSKCVVAFYGQKTEPGWFQKEVKEALETQSKNPLYPVIPVLLPGCDPERIEGFQFQNFWIDLRLDIDSHEEYRRLVSGIKGESPGPPKEPDDEEIIEEKDFLEESLMNLQKLRNKGLVHADVDKTTQQKLMDKKFNLGK